jgi:SHAQKYF class myb-like DNA-binding protein
MKQRTHRRREGNFHCGRWQQDEHQRFIEAILKYGNEWKQVQKHVGTRSSTQARSHAQKFFVKIKKSNLFEFNFDLSKNSIKTLHNLTTNLNGEEYVNAIKALNCVAFERKANGSRRRGRKEDLSAATDSFINELSTMYSNSLSWK